MQTIAIGWIFGTKKFANCVEQMTGFKPNLYWTLTWGVIAPLVCCIFFSPLSPNFFSPLSPHFEAF